MIERIIDDEFLNKYLFNVCEEFSILFQDLKVKTLLHLPRFTASELENEIIIDNEVMRIAESIRNTHSKYSDAININFKSSKLQNFDIKISNDFEINLLIGKLHYLESIRDGSLHLTLFNIETNTPVGIASISDFDLFHLNIYNYSPNQIKILSRFYTLNNLPQNANSYFMGLIFKWLRDNYSNTSFLLTYLNKNVGFKGTNYKASNWKLFALELNTRYNYFNSKYVTDRFLIKKFGSSKRQFFKYNEEVSFSKISLLPLEIYYYELGRELHNFDVQKINIIRK